MRPTPLLAIAPLALALAAVSAEARPGKRTDPAARAYVFEGRRKPIRTHRIHRETAVPRTRLRRAKPRARATAVPQLVTPLHAESPGGFAIAVAAFERWSSAKIELETSDFVGMRVTGKSGKNLKLVCDVEPKVALTLELDTGAVTKSQTVTKGRKTVTFTVPGAAADQELTMRSKASNGSHPHWSFYGCTLDEI
ncbi:MAG: hypothetical protein AAF721_27965 [Myxococcota bacterium]